MYQLINHKGSCRICEIYELEGSMGYVPIGLFDIIADSTNVFKDLMHQWKTLRRIPYGEFLKEQIIEALLYD